MPVFKMAKVEVTSEEEQSTVYFIARRNWFGLSMTEGREYAPDPVPDFAFCRCMEELSIRKEPYQAMSGNSMGYAKTAERIIAVSRLAFDPFKTTAHEIAHLIPHPKIFSDHNGLPRDAKEVEAHLYNLHRPHIRSAGVLEFGEGVGSDQGRVDRFLELFLASRRARSDKQPGQLRHLWQAW